MLDGISLHFRVSRLHRKKRLLEKRFQRDIADAKATYDKDEEDNLIRDFHHYCDEIDDEIRFATSQNLIKEADILILTRPEFDTKSKSWIKSSLSGRYHLNTYEITHLRDALRKEKKERWELYRAWLPGVTGLVGTATGLVALLLKSCSN